jgi:hypothetical protein
MWVFLTWDREAQGKIQKFGEAWQGEKMQH